MYTVEVYKKDARTKKGERLYYKEDVDSTDRAHVELLAELKWPAKQGFRCTVHQTMVQRTTIFGKPFVERYDTPYYCSPSSETYWSS